jgi:phage tail-like protein
MAGWLQSLEGGQAAGDAIAGRLGQYPTETKHIAGVKYEDITLSCGTGMSPHFYEWIKAATDSQYERRNGQIVTCDENFRPMSALDFSNAIITEVGFPALDAASKDAAKMTIKIRPEWTRINARPGGSVSGMINTKAQKKWLPSNFRLEIAGLDSTRVNKIEAITVKQKVVESPVGAARGYQKESGNVEVSKLVFTLPEAQAESFYKEAVGKRGSGKREDRPARLPERRHARIAVHYKVHGPGRRESYLRQDGSRQ